MEEKVKITLNGKCKQDFEKWYSIENKCHRDNAKLLHEYPNNMKYGVYVDFFDNFEITIFVSKSITWHVDIYDKNKEVVEYGYNVLKSRQEARIKAIEKANEIYNRNN